MFLSKIHLSKVSKTKGGNVENFNIIKDGNGRLTLEEADVRRIWKEYYENLYNIDTTDIIFSFDTVWGATTSEES